MSPFAHSDARRLASAIAAVSACVLTPAIARAHFVLEEPPSTLMQDAQGQPEKMPPCGDDGTGVPTNTVTPFAPGDEVSITVHEVVTHGGHYRVALAVNDESELPADPDVSVTGTQCQMDDVESTPTFPVLADGLLQHAQNQPLDGAQTFKVKLPTDVTCDKCILQVREYMTPHAAPCFYHHCAYISIKGGSSAGGAGSGGMSAGGAGGTSAGGMSAGGTGAVSAGGMSAGGATGQAGMGMSLAGSSTSGGAPGASGSGGTLATAGSAAMGTGGTGGSASGSGGSLGVGGSIPGSGGTTPAGNTAGSATSPDATQRDAETGCGCRVPARGHSTPLGAAGLLAVGLWFASRRARSS